MTGLRAGGREGGGVLLPLPSGASDDDGPLLLAPVRGNECGRVRQNNDEEEKLHVWQAGAWSFCVCCVDTQREGIGM